MGADFRIAVTDADQYTLSLAGVAIAVAPGQSGFNQDEFFSISQVSDSFEDDVGADGWVERWKTNDRRVEGGITLLQSSSSNDYLSSLHALDCNQPNGAGVGSLQLKDLQGTTLILCTRTWIAKPADVALGRKSKPRKWKLRGIWSIYLVGSN